MIKYQNSVASTIDGTPIIGAQVLVTISGQTGQEADVFADSNGTTQLTQPLVTDQQGSFFFYAADGRYTVTVSAAETTISQTDITIVDSLSVKNRALLAPENDSGSIIPPVAERAGKLLMFNEDGTSTAALPNSFPGDPGPAFATFFTLPTFKAAPTSNATQVLQASGIPAGTFIWTSGDYTGQADDLNIIKADSSALSVGAWVRQKADGIAASLPGFPAIVKTLGDALPYISPGEFFGIKSDGVADDTAALQAAIDAVANNSRARGGLLQLRPGGLTRTGSQIILKPYVRLDLRGGTLQANLNGGNDAGLRPMSYSEVGFGMIDVRSTGTPGSSASVHAPIFAGVDYSSLVDINSPDPLDNVVGFYGHDLVLTSDKDRGPVSTGGAAAVQFAANVSSCVMARIYVPSSSKLQQALGLDWGIRGRKPDGTQALFSDPSKMTQNLSAFNAGYAITTHPHDNRFEDWIIGDLSRPRQNGVPDSGTSAARESAAYGNSFYNFRVASTTEAAFVHHMGDLGYEFASETDLRRAARGSVFEKMFVADAKGGHGIKTDSKADNVARAQTDYGYSPRFNPVYQTDVQFTDVTGRTTVGASTNGFAGLYCFSQRGGVFTGIDMVGFEVGARFDGVADVTEHVGRYSFSRKQNVWVHGGSTNVRINDPEDISYGNRSGGGFSNVHFENGARNGIYGGTIGAMGSDESALHGILCGAAADGNSETTIKGVRVNSHGSGGFAIVAGSSSAWGTLREISGVTYGSFVTNKYTGESAQPVSRDGANAPAEYVMTQGSTISDAIASLSGKTVARGERYRFTDPSASGKEGLIAVGNGLASTTTLKGFGSVDA